MEMSSDTKNYDLETIEPLISTKLPICKEKDNLEDVVRSLNFNVWDDANYLFVLDSKGMLVGVIDLTSLTSANRESKAGDLMRDPEIILKPHDKRQKAIHAAVKKDSPIIPVVDSENKFIGALISKTILDVMHNEHIETVLLSSGIRVKKSKALGIVSAGLFETVKSRLPWLLFGLIVGLGLGFISSLFEDKLQGNVAIAYFIPVVAYIADSVGTQSEAITVRSLATLRLSGYTYLLRELMVGIVMGVIIGFLGSLGALFISAQLNVAIVVGFSLFVASAIAASLASLIPMLFKAFDKDPALGSGPLATAIQDLLSIIIYFVFVSLLL